MATSIFSLFGEIFVDNDKANKEIDKTTQKGETLGSKLSTGFAAVGKGALVLGTAAVAAGTALTGVAISTANAAGEISDASAAAGVSAEEFQKYAYAASMGGVSAETLTKSMARVNKTLADATEGNKAAGDAFARLGLDISTLSEDEAFDAVVKKLADMEDETERNALANDIFGRSYADLAPLLNEGADGIQALKDEAVELGAVMSNDAVEAGDTLGDTLDKLSAAGGGLMNTLGGALVPIIQSVADTLIGMIPTLMPIVEQIMPVLASLLTTIAPILLNLITTLLPPLLNIITSLMPLFDTLVQAVLPPILSLITLLLPYIVEVVDRLVPILVDLLTTLLPIVMPIIDAFLPVLLDLLDMLLDPLLDLLDLILPPLTTVINVLGGAISGSLTSAFEGLQPIIETVKKHFQLLIDFVENVFKGDWKAAWNGIKEIFSNIWNGLGSAVKVPINIIIGYINGLITRINGMKVPDWVPFLGGKSINIRTIPKLAAGGDIVGEGWAMVGEAGPEMLHLPQGAQVKPLKDGGGLTIHIDTFVNNRKQDVKEFAEELEAYRRRAAMATGGAPA